MLAKLQGAVILAGHRASQFSQGDSSGETLGYFPGLARIESQLLRLHVHIRSSDMKMVFYSRDRLEVQRVSQELVAASIPCEVREGLVARDDLPNLSAPQLWIQEDGDLHRAFMVCVERSIGFAKRETESPELNDCDRAIAA